MRLGNVHPSEAERYIKRYWERYPEVERFVTQTLEEATELGYATTLFGRRRYVPELQSPNKNTRKLGERYAFNAAVQGTAADIIKVAMVDLAPRLEPLGADMLMQVHDELVFDVDEDAVDEVAALAAERMVAAYDLDPPLEVEIEVGERWGRGREWSAEV
jgi:DNA polymerase-1